MREATKENHISNLSLSEIGEFLPNFINMKQEYQSDNYNTNREIRPINFTPDVFWIGDYWIDKKELENIMEFKQIWYVAWIPGARDPQLPKQNFSDSMARDGYEFFCKGIRRKI